MLNEFTAKFSQHFSRNFVRVSASNSFWSRSLDGSRQIPEKQQSTMNTKFTSNFFVPCKNPRRFVLAQATHRWLRFPSNPIKVRLSQEESWQTKIPVFVKHLKQTSAGSHVVVLYSTNICTVGRQTRISFPPIYTETLYENHHFFKSDYPSQNKHGLSIMHVQQPYIKRF